MDLRSRYDAPVPTIVLAEGTFGTPTGKTANGVVMHSTLFEPRAVIDSTNAGRSAGAVLSNPSVEDVPIVESVGAALSAAPEAAVLVLGVAPAGGELSPDLESALQEAMASGCDVVSGLHVFLNDDPAWQSLADEHGVDIVDVRKPPTAADLKVADGSRPADTYVVLVMGTDCASGKRTTTMELFLQATELGLDAAWVATGQTGIMVGAHRGVVIDRVPADFTAGVVESMVADLADRDIVFVEGQAALTHRAYGGVTLSILAGAWPDVVVIADDPEREVREHFESLPVPSVHEEAAIIESLSAATVAGISSWGDPDEVEYDLDVPVANIYHDDGPARLLSCVRNDLGTAVDGDPA